jgi:hypothetical protein
MSVLSAGRAKPGAWRTYRDLFAVLFVGVTIAAAIIAAVAGLVYLMLAWL